MSRYEAFISYSREDERLVQPLVQLLRLNKRRVFLDVSSIKPGERWADSIEQALRDSEVVILLWCCHSSQSEWVAREARIALDHRKPLVPILLCPFPIVEPVGDYQGIDFVGAINHHCMDHPASGGGTAGNLEDVQWFLSRGAGIGSLAPAELSTAWRRIKHNALQKALPRFTIFSAAGLILLGLALVRPFPSVLGETATRIVNWIMGALGALLMVGSLRKNPYEQLIDADYPSQLLALTVESVLRLAERGDLDLRRRHLVEQRYSEDTRKQESEMEL